MLNMCEHVSLNDMQWSTKTTLRHALFVQCMVVNGINTMGVIRQVFFCEPKNWESP